MTVVRPLPITPYLAAVEKANAKIRENMTDEQPVLITRWAKLNSALGSGFRFERVYVIAGNSGSGKSYFLNMLLSDFISINGKYRKPFKILCFSFEMEAADEVIRSYTGKLKTSYGTLLSFEKKLTEDEYSDVIKVSASILNDTIYFVETSGNVSQIWETVVKFNNMFPSHQIIVTIDHTLLAETMDEKSEVELTSNVAKLALKIRKTIGAMVIVLSQLNDKMETSERRDQDNPRLHFPVKTDLFSSKAVFFCSDTLAVLHRPELLNLNTYGPERWPVKNLVAMHILKDRFAGNAGILRFRQDFANGNLICPYDNVSKEF